MTLPTLFLGLGGTGKDALMHLRRRFLDEYAAGAMPEALRDRYGPARLPHTAYLCIDADDKMEDLDGRAFDEFMRGAMLTEGEFINVELNPDRVRALYDQPERFPEYSRWFDFGLEKSGVPKHGCGQTRPWGRMAFFQHYERIRERLRSVLSSLVVVTAGRDARAVGVDDLETAAVQVFVVFSVAGGTGSGLFLDVAFLLQDVGRELGVKVTAEAMIVLPELFSPDPTNRVYANAYAALMEIEYYNLRREGAADLDAPNASAGTEGVFPVYWPGRSTGRETVTLRGPVFEPVWLIGARSRGVDGQGAGTVVNRDHKSELTGMIAEWMFLRTAPRLRTVSADINTRASNYAAVEMVATAAIPVYEAGDDRPTGTVELSCRYGSFGLAKIYAPVNVAAQMAGDHVVLDIITDWLRDTRATPSDEELDRDIRPKVKLRTTSRDSQDTRHEDALYDLIDRESQVTAAGVVSEAAEAFGAAFHPRMAEDAGEMLASQLRDRFRDFQWAATSTQSTDNGLRGQYAERVRRSTARVFADVRTGLDEVISEALCETSRRFPYAQAALNRLEIEFSDLAARAEGRANDTGARLADQVRDIGELLGYAANERSRFTLRSIAKVAMDYQGEVVRLELEGQIWGAVAAGAKDVAGVIGQANLDDGGQAQASLLKQLDELANNLRALSGRLGARVAGLANRHESILNKEIVPREKKTYYVDADGRPIDAKFLRAAERKLYGEPKVFRDARSPSSWALRGRFQGAERELLLTSLSEFGRSVIGQPPPTNVTILLDHAYEGGGGDREYANAIRQNVQSGTAWLATRETGREGGWRSEVNYTVACAGRGGVSAERLENVFRSTFGEARARFIEGPPEVIYFEQELAAFPLSVAPGIRDWRDRAYLPLLLRQAPAHAEAQGGGGGLHIELNVEKYIDLVEPTRDEATRRAEAIQLFIEALLKGRLTPHRDRFGLVHYRFNQTAGLGVKSTDFGRYDRAIRTLANRAAQEAKDLRGQVEEVEVAWDGAPDRGKLTKARILVVLDRYINSPDDSPVRGAEWTRNANRLNLGFIERWGADTYALAKTERASLDTWAVKSPVGGGHLTPPDLPDLLKP